MNRDGQRTAHRGTIAAPAQTSIPAVQPAMQPCQLRACVINVLAGIRLRPFANAKASTMYISVIASRIQPAAKPANPPNSSAEPKAAKPMASPGGLAPLA